MHPNFFFTQKFSNKVAGCAYIASILVQSISIPICCPPGWLLLENISEFFRTKKYDCIRDGTADQNITNWHILKYSLGYNGHKVGQFNTTGIRFSIPNCEQHTIKEFIVGGEVKFSPHSCIMPIERGLLVVSCPLQNHEEMQELVLVQKCCPLNYVYNSTIHKCVNRAKVYELFHTEFHRHFMLINTSVICPENTVVVENNFSADDLRFVNGKLEVQELDGKYKFNTSNYCVEAIEGETKSHNHTEYSGKFLVRTCTSVEICRRIPCIRRCCAHNEMFIKNNGTSFCEREDNVLFHSFESLGVREKFSKPFAVFGILQKLDCRKFKLDPDSYSNEDYTISDEDGSLNIINTQASYKNNQYCLEKIKSHSLEDGKLHTFICFDANVIGSDEIRFKMYPIGLLVSCSFYAVTLLVYLFVPKLTNLPGKILICLVSSLFTAYLAIALGQLMPPSNNEVCFASGFFVYFCLMAAFAWMNVMCFDIWHTFGSSRRKHIFKSDEWRIFYIYSSYGWGIPVIFTTITISLSKSNLFDHEIRPEFGYGRCWFSYSTYSLANFLFFSGPLGVLYVINFVLFYFTLRYCNKVKKDIYSMQTSNAEKCALRRRFFIDKVQFVMNTKLFIVMGITWLFEILSILLYDHKNNAFWAISDSFNVFLGVFVFFIFVFKRRVWRAILERLRHTESTARKTTYNTSSW